MKTFSMSGRGFVLSLFLAGLAAGPAQAAIEGNQWFPIGPAPGFFEYFFGGAAGRISAVALNEHNVNELWVGTSWGGVWHTVDLGATWTPISDYTVSLAIGSLAVADCDPTGCRKIFAGTGENAIRRDTMYGAGLLVGTVLPGGFVYWDVMTGSPYNFLGRSIIDIVLDESTSGDNQVIWIALSSGVTAASTHSTVTSPAYPRRGYGLYKSSNNGNTWLKLNVSGAEGYKPTDLEVDPNLSQVMYAGFLGRGIFKTLNGGDTWCPLNPGIPKPSGCSFYPFFSGLPNPDLTTFDHVEITIHKANPSILYASFGRCPNPFLTDCAPSIYRSTNFGHTWTKMYEGSEQPLNYTSVQTILGDVYEPDCPAAYSRYTNGLSAHPTIQNTLFLAGLRLCRSIDGGATWSVADHNVLGGMWVPRLHYDHRAVVFHPTNPAFMYDLNDGGIAISFDGGIGWHPRTGNLQTMGFQSIATSPLTPRVIGGVQDNSGQMWTGTDAWTYLPCCGDGGFSVMDGQSINTMYLTTNSRSQGQFTVIPVRSQDGGICFPYPTLLQPHNCGANDTYSYNNGLDLLEPRAFYPPLVKDPSFSQLLYFGTNRLYRSDDRMQTWTPISTVLSTTPAPEILAQQDVITAIGVAPGSPSQIYIGYYSGKVFRPDHSCIGPGCWDPADVNLPSAPITSLAVDPSNQNTVYATLGGFRPGNHVYKTTNGGDYWFPAGAVPNPIPWPPFGTTQSGVPANTIVVEPGAPNRLWLGTDRGLFKSHNWGASWYPFSTGMPLNAPIFQIAIDETRGRVFAATHGRGVFILTKPFVDSFLRGDGHGQLSRIAVHGRGFAPNEPCTMKLLQQDSTVCAAASMDAVGGDIETSPEGKLKTDQNNLYNNFSIAWACKDGDCIGSKKVSDCDEPGNRLAAVMVICGQDVGIDVISPIISPVTNPPSSWTTLTGLDSFPSIGGPQPATDGLLGGSFDLLPTLQAEDGTTRVLCSVNVPFTPDETPRRLLERARDGVNGDGACMASGVSAFVATGQAFEVEDLFPEADQLKLEGPLLTGTQLVPSLRAAPGQATDVCFHTSKLGVPVREQLQSMRLRFETPGATGGDVILKMNTVVGFCSLRVPIAAGQTAAGIAQAVADAFQAPGIPGPHLDCPAESNPRDVTRQGDSIFMSLAGDIEVCVEDPAVGFAIAPREICFAASDCDDGNPCTLESCDAATRACLTQAGPDGVPCDDGDVCTVGDTCVGGACGIPVSCDDGNPCTEDACSPAAPGACAHSPVQCDDGNVCTLDYCSAGAGGAGGGCVSEPMAQQDCDDGDGCTTGDTCVSDPDGSIACQGTLACIDGDPCTEDLCDGATGACQNPPLECEDGDPCTIDSCTAGACQSAPQLDLNCDDDNACTTSDFCQDDGAGGVACLGTAITCDDGSACTIDSCDQATGVCSFSPVVVSPVTDVQFLDEATLTWMPPPGAGFSNTYRGTIPTTMMGSRAVGGPYDHACFESGDAFGDGAAVSTDTSIPPLGEAFYFPVSFATACGESPPCFDSNGTPCPIPSPCGGPGGP